jgi:hypothetical protein
MLPILPKGTTNKMTLKPKPVTLFMGRYRERVDLAAPTVVGRAWITQNDVIISDITYGNPSPSATGQAMRAERTWDRCNPGPPYRSGGGFTSIKSRNPWREVQGQTSVERVNAGAHLVYHYSGGFTPLSFGVTNISLNDMSNAGKSGTYGPSYGESASYGASAYARYKPKQSTANAAVFLGEIRDTPRMLKATAKAFHDIWKGLGGHAGEFFSSKALSDNWLNTQFGWIPFLSDLQDFHRTYRDTNSILRRLKRENGSWQTRGGTMEETDETSNVDNHDTENAPLVYPTLLSNYYAFPYPGQPNKFGSTTTSQNIKHKIWLEAKFKYWMPELLKDNDHGYNHAMNRIRLYGARLTPSTVYQIIPWSWLGDWATNAGDVIDNVSTQFSDNLTAKYAYVMRHTYKANHNSSTIHFHGGGTSHCSWTQEIETKTRTGASPFGFGLSPDQLTGRQISILAALGISRHW